jgi:phosphatidylserine decarboxylase
VRLTGTGSMGSGKGVAASTSGVAGGMILREGLPFVAPFLAIGVVGLAVGWCVLGWAGLLCGLAVALFFRNPVRRPLRDPRVALSPADGRIVEISRVQEVEGRPGPFTKVSVFMSVLNVHVNRAPVSGMVVEVNHRPGRFDAAYRQETSSGNERNLVRIQMDGGREVICVQVAGVLARRIVCWAGEGSRVLQGTPFGLIRFGSRVDTYLPDGFDPDVRMGQRVWGGETVLGYFVDPAGGAQ